MFSLGDGAMRPLLPCPPCPDVCWSAKKSGNVYAQLIFLELSKSEKTHYFSSLCAYNPSCMLKFGRHRYVRFYVLVYYQTRKWGNWKWKLTQAAHLLKRRILEHKACLRFENLYPLLTASIHKCEFCASMEVFHVLGQAIDLCSSPKMCKTGSRMHVVLEIRCCCRSSRSNFAQLVARFYRDTINCIF